MTNKYKIARQVLLNGTHRLVSNGDIWRLGPLQLYRANESNRMFLRSRKYNVAHFLTTLFMDQLNNQIAHFEVYNNERVALQAHCKSTLVRK